MIPFYAGSQAIGIPHGKRATLQVSWETTDHLVNTQASAQFHRSCNSTGWPGTSRKSYTDQISEHISGDRCILYNEAEIRAFAGDRKNWIRVVVAPNKPARWWWWWLSYEYLYPRYNCASRWHLLNLYSPRVRDIWQSFWFLPNGILFCLTYMLILLVWCVEIQN